MSLKKAIIAHPIKKLTSIFFYQLGDICYYHRMCQKRRPAPGVHSSPPHSGSRDDRRQRSGLFRAGDGVIVPRKRQWPDADIALVTRGRPSFLAHSVVVAYIAKLVKKNTF
jgi:hypothetical protein